MNTKTIPTHFHFYSDPGHGWLAVKRELLHRLGIAHLISTYSYQRGKTVYLEEDCDFSTFIGAYLRATGAQPSYTDHNSPHRRSPIRSYEYYKKEESK